MFVIKFKVFPILNFFKNAGLLVTATHTFLLYNYTPYHIILGNEKFRIFTKNKNYLPIWETQIQWFTQVKSISNILLVKTADKSAKPNKL